MRSKSWADTEASPLTLLAGYKRNPDAFARPGPPPQPPLPLKFTEQLKELRTTVINDPKLSKEECEDLKLAIIVLLILVNHRMADGE